MGISQRRKRPDLPFLTRRIRPEDQLPASTPMPAPAVAPAPASMPQAPLATPAAATPGLSLGGRPTTAPAPASPTSTASGTSVAGLSLGNRPPAARPAPAGSPGLSLGAPPVEAIGRHAPPSVTPPAVPELLTPFPAPTATEVHELTEALPMVRLNARQSGIGSLSLIGTGTIAWESRTGMTGSASHHGTMLGRFIPTAGNRPLVELDAGRGLIALRHLAQLRRALFICAPDTELSIALYDGLSVALPKPAPGRRNVLLLTRVGNLLELRSDPAPADLDDAPIWGAFGFKMSVPLPPSAGAS